MNMVSPVATAAYYPEFNISISINLKSVRALIIRLRGMPDFDLDTSELDERVRQFEGKLDFMAENNQQFRDYIRELEQQYTEIKYREPLDISPAEAVRIAEEFIRKKPDN